MVYPGVASTKVIWKDEPPALTTVDDTFREVWNESGETVGAFTGSASRFTIDTVPRAQIAAASNGADALVIAGGHVHHVTRGGIVTATANLGVIDEPQLAWDGSAYVAAFDGNGMLLHPPRGTAVESATGSRSTSCSAPHRTARAISSAPCSTTTSTCRRAT